MQTEENVIEETIRLSELKPHPDNPRTITKDALEELKGSIKELSKMFEMRPIAYDENGIVWGGNQRYHGLIELGYEEIPKKWTFEMQGWTLPQKKAFAILDNRPFGDWDKEKLDSEYWKDYIVEYGPEELKSYFDNDVNSDDFGTDFDLPSGDREPIQQITFTLADDQANAIKAALSEIKNTDEYKSVETFGNQNSNGNALYLLVTQWIAANYIENEK